MKQEIKKLFRPLNLLVLTILISASLYIYYGFFFVDTTIYYLYWATAYLYKVIYYLFPILTIALVIMYLLVYLKKIQIGSVILMIVTFFILLLLLFPFADYFYRKELSENSSNYHSYLQINPPVVNEIDSSKLNIFCLGGSTTEFRDKKNRDWPGLLEKELLKTDGFSKVKVHNIGRQWYSTQHILINYILNLREYKPDVIIVMENINDMLHNADFSWLSNGEFRDDYGNFLGPLTRLIKFGGFSEYFLKTINGLWYQDKPVEIEANEFPGLKAFERNLNTIITLAREDDTKVILMTQPNLYKDTMSVEEISSLGMIHGEAVGNGKKWTYSTGRNGMRLYNDKIREIAKTNDGVALIDLELHVPKTLDYFYDDVHYTSEAYDIIAPYIAEKLREILGN
jgi:lysophospholipase L1-like esterase